MCRSKPYPRCSAHAFQKLEKAEVALSKLSPHDPLFQDASIRYSKALKDFYLTPKGLDVLNLDVELGLPKSKNKYSYYARLRKNLIEAGDLAKQGLVRTCAQCEMKIDLQHDRFCSRDCRRAYLLKNHSKQCTRCGRTPEETAFSNNKGTFDGLSSICKQCKSADQSQRLSEYSPERKKEIKERAKSDAYRDTMLKRNYGISLDQLNKLMSEQVELCKICQTPFDDQNVFCVDHDHQTGRVRGLLCRTCNWGLGHFKDSPQLLARAQAYLSHSSKMLEHVNALLFRPGEKRIDLRHLRPLRISEEGRSRLLKFQESRCAICDTHIGHGITYHIDHAHSNGLVRGALCVNCNVGLGQLKDDSILMQACIKYLQV